MKVASGFKNFERVTSGPWFSTSLVLLRIALGAMFFMAGVTKLNGWSAEGYLLGASGPFADFFHSLAGSMFVDQLNIWGLILIGVCLFFGIFVRPASFFASILMLFYYFAHFVQNTEHGLIDEHLIYILIFVLFMSGGVGHVFGLDGILYRQMRKSPFMRTIFFG